MPLLKLVKVVLNEDLEPWYGTVLDFASFAEPGDVEFALWLKKQPSARIPTDEQVYDKNSRSHGRIAVLYSLEDIKEAGRLAVELRCSNQLQLYLKKIEEDPTCYLEHSW